MATPVPAPVPHALHSFRTLADFVSSDSELLILKRFDWLNVRILLYLQSEIEHLQSELQQIDKQDLTNSQSDDYSCASDAALAAGSWRYILGSENQSERLALIRKIQRATKEYNEALIAAHRVLELRAPKKHPWIAFRNWITQNKPLIDPGANEMKTAEDFVALVSVSGDDRISDALEQTTGMVLAYFKNRGPNDNGLIYYSERPIRRMVSVITVAGATVLLEVAVVVLYFVDNAHVQLGLIAVFTVTFATALGVLSNSRLAEVFAATAAFAAVLVVFLSQNISARKA